MQICCILQKVLKTNKCVIKSESKFYTMFAFRFHTKLFYSLVIFLFGMNNSVHRVCEEK
jgi:hypothetical protein